MAAPQINSKFSRSQTQFGNEKKVVFWQQWLVPFAIFLLALIVRIPALGEFVTVDEPFWVDRSRLFTTGLLFAQDQCPPLPRDGRPFASRGWGCTFQTAHPGVTTMWGGSLGLLAHYWQVVRPTGVDVRTYLQTLTTDPLDRALIAPVRLPLAIIAALFVPLFYILLKWLLPERVALISALLLALNPFHIALSRVLHQDALTTTFMTLSLLTMIGYWLQGWRWPWLLISAVCAGLAYLSKPVGWFMLPSALVVAGLSLLLYRRPGLWHFAGEGLAWVIVTVITFFAFFPAMWVIPAEVIRSIFAVSTSYSEAGHIDGHYFLGQISRDPGLLFYPITWLWRTSPLELAGLLALLLAAWQVGRGRSVAMLRQRLMSQPVLLALALFIGMLLIFEMLSSKKMDRYFLPAFPAIEVFAALGLLWLSDYLIQFTQSHKPPIRASSLRLLPSPLASRRFFASSSPRLLVLVSLVLLLQGWFILANSPYYFTYYNPLLGGASSATRLMTIFGWGEGMDQVAAYLNQQPHAESLRVIAGYEDTLKPFFMGKVESSRNAGEIITADYVVYYRNQLQRRLQNVDAWRYFEGHSTPVQRVTLQGLDYALIYKTPIQRQVTPEENSLPHTATFGYNLAPSGQLTLFWQNQGLSQPIWAGLTPAAGGEILWLPCQLSPAFSAEANIPGALLETQCDLATAKAAPNLYDLRFGLGSEAAITPIEFPAGRLALAVDVAGHFAPVEPAAALARLAEQALPPGAIPLDIPLGQTARLVGYKLELDTWQPGHTGVLWLYWQSIQSLDLAQFANVFQLILRLKLPAASEPILTTAQPLIPADFATQGLAQGAIAPTRYTLSLPSSLPPAEYSLEVCALTTVEAKSTDCLPLSVIIANSEPGQEQVESK